MVQWLRRHAPNAGGLGLISCQGTIRSHMLQLKIKDSAEATKTKHSQTSK